MATGDANDILSRVKQVIPYRWFSFVAPFRDAVLGGPSDLAAWCYSWVGFARLQSRIATSTGPFLDLIALDFTGRYLQRNGTVDNTFRARIQATILQERVTRKGMINALTALTGTAPIIIEPWNTRDIGAYGAPTTAYGVSRYGSMQLPAQVFIIVKVGATPGVPNTAGYGTAVAGYGAPLAIWSGLSLSTGGITDEDIYSTILATKPTGSIAWTQIL
jgi:hypothetical protein